MYQLNPSFGTNYTLLGMLQEAEKKGMQYVDAVHVDVLLQGTNMSFFSAHAFTIHTPERRKPHSTHHPHTSKKI